MDRNLEVVLDDALHLDTNSRAILAEKVIESLPTDLYQEEWLDEVERRKSEWDAGIVKGIDASEVIREARELIRNDNGKTAPK